MIQTPLCPTVRHATLVPTAAAAAAAAAPVDIEGRIEGELGAWPGYGFLVVGEEIIPKTSILFLHSAEMQTTNKNKPKPAQLAHIDQPRDHPTIYNLQ